LFRLHRIAYTNFKWPKSVWLYILAIPIQELVGLILIIPLPLWKSIIYLTSDYYCMVSISIILGFLWSTMVSVGLPLTYLCVIYLRVIRFMRQRSNAVSLVIKRRQQRDLAVMQRIFFIVGALMLVGFPAVVMFFITGVQPPLLYRLSFAALGVSMAVLSIGMVLITPQLKNILFKRWLQNRVTIDVGPVPIRPIINTNTKNCKILVQRY
jgi:hypothetical protein